MNCELARRPGQVLELTIRRPAHENSPPGSCKFAASLMEEPANVGKLFGANRCGSAFGAFAALSQGTDKLFGARAAVGGIVANARHPPIARCSR